MPRELTDGERNIIRNVRNQETPGYPELAEEPDDHILWIYNMWNEGDKQEPLVDWLIDFRLPKPGEAD